MAVWDMPSNEVGAKVGAMSDLLASVGNMNGLGGISGMNPMNMG